MSELYRPSPWGHTFHSLPHNEALGAGSAGPGKSTVLRMDPMTQVYVEHERCMNKEHPYHIPWGSSTGWALHLRRTRPMLEPTIQALHRIIPQVDPGAKWNENKMTWTFRSGYRYQLGHCHDDNDWQNYLSFEFTHIGYDEAVQFTEEQYDQINTRLRSSDPILRQMLKIRAMSNPLMKREKGENFSIKDPNWIRRRFVDGAPEGKTTFRKTLTMMNGEKVDYTWIYLPATLYDNPDKEFVRDYETKLQNAKPHIRQALLYGNWYTTVGSYYAESWNSQLHTCEPFRIPSEWPKFRSMDWGFKLPGIIHWWAMDPDGNIFCFRELKFQGMTDAEVADAIKQIEIGMGVWKNGKSTLQGPADTQLWEQRGDSAKSKAAVMAEKGVIWTPADKRSRTRNAELLTKRLSDHEGGTTTPGIVFFKTCQEIIKLIPAIQTSDKSSEEPADGNDDHAHDSVLYACAYASHGKSGISWRDPDEDGREEEKPKNARGRWGYGSRLM